MSLILVLTVSAIFGSLFVTSKVIYNVFDASGAVTRTYNSYYSTLINEQFYFRELDSTIQPLIKSINIENIKNLDDALSVARVSAGTLINDNKVANIRSKFNLVDDNRLEKFLTFSIFYVFIENNNKLLDEFVNKKRIAISVWDNRAELLTQFFLICLGLGFLISFFYSKSNIFKVIKTVSRPMDKCLMIDQFEHVNNEGFKNRKKFHYLLAFISAVFFVAIHVIGIQKTSGIVGSFNSDIFGLTAYDYRMNANTPLLLIIHWSIQFFLIYFIVLTGWEIRQLNISKHSIIAFFLRNKFRLNIFPTESSIANYSPNNHLWGIVYVGVVLALLIISFWKVMVSGDFELAGEFAFNKILFSLYIFSPFLTVSVFLIFINLLFPFKLSLRHFTEAIEILLITIDGSKGYSDRYAEARVRIENTIEEIKSNKHEK